MQDHLHFVLCKQGNKVQVVAQSRVWISGFFSPQKASRSGFQTLSGSPIPKYWSIIPWALKGLCHEDIAISSHFCALLPTTYTK